MEEKYTQSTIYEMIYLYSLLRYITNHDLDKARRLSTRIAVKKTWYMFNNQDKLYKPFITLCENYELSNLITFIDNGSEFVAISISLDKITQPIRFYYILGLTHEIDYNKKISLSEIIESSVRFNHYVGTLKNINEKIIGGVSTTVSIKINESFPLKVKKVLNVFKPSLK